MTRDPETGLIAIEMTMDQGKTYVAVVTPDEAEKVANIFTHAVEHMKRGESVRIDLRSAFIDLIGRDPFEGQ